MTPALLGLIAALSWGLHDFAARFASRSVGPLRTVGAVTAFGLLALTVLLAALGRWPVWHLDGLWLVVLSGAGFALATLWLFAALALAPISLVAPIVGSYPVLVVLYEVATGRVPTLLDALAIVGVVAGVAIVASYAPDEPGSAAPENPRAGRAGVLGLALLANLSFALAITRGQRAAPVFGELEATWLARIVGFATLALVLLVTRTGMRLPVRWLPLLIAMGLLDVMALAVLLAAGHGPGASIATVVSSCFGAVAVLLGRIVLAERVHPLQWLGIVMVFGGVAVLLSGNPAPG
ncbi:MAG: EamA family transporter [Rhizobiales bacterium]|nr:EamA family transporter [Hyphomicrobiales bacterium]